MRIASLLPLLAFAGIGTHMVPTLKAKVAGASTAKDTYIVKSKLAVVADALALAVGTGDPYPPTQTAFREFVRHSVRKKGPKDDPSLDLWGMPLRYALESGQIVVVSAGPDKTNGTIDDVQVERSPGDL